MTLPSFTMRQLLEAGVHFGHNTRRWNPKMETFIFGERNGIHIIDLQQTMPLLLSGLKILRDTTANGGRVLFVGTKRNASEKLAETATACGQYYVNHRWLGGMLTNWSTVSQSIRRLKNLETRLQTEEVNQLGKKEILQLNREKDKLDLTLGGIKEMGGLPNILFVLDTNKEKIAVLEANKLNIPVVAIVDSNANPDGVDFPIPGNDDAMRAISLYCELAKSAILDGLEEEMRLSGKDVGATDELSENISEELNEDENMSSKSETKEELQHTSEEKAVSNVAEDKKELESSPSEKTINVKEKVSSNNTINKNKIENQPPTSEKKLKVENNQKLKDKVLSSKDKKKKSKSDTLSKPKTKSKS